MKDELQNKQVVRAQTYTILPENQTMGTATITCNSVESAAETAKIFFWTPCRLVLPGESLPSYLIEKDGTLKDLK
jgi:hypothetical protein|tara:strand:+ start:617 stop:841 length:225 start_codon:yes stop_codon:yes gene_type:complete